MLDHAGSIRMCRNDKKKQVFPSTSLSLHALHLWDWIDSARSSYNTFQCLNQASNF